MIIANDFSKAYDIHKYWSRKPAGPIAYCIDKFSREGDLVVDMFLGSGVTALEAVALNRNFIGFDLNPMSIFITRNTLSADFVEDEFMNEYLFLLSKIQPIGNKVYSVSDKCTNCGSNLWIQHLNVGPKFTNNETGVFYCPSCQSKKIVRSASPEEVYRGNSDYQIKKWTPSVLFPKLFFKDRFSYKGISSVNDMFSKRNLFVLSELLDLIKKTPLQYKELFLVAFSNTLLHASKLKSENVRPLGVNNYWIPDDYIEENVIFRFKERVKKIIRAKKELKNKLHTRKLGHYELYTQSCLSTSISSSSVDYVLTDPPYGESIQYSELSFLWNAWLDRTFDQKEEVIINPVQKKGASEYLSLFERSVIEAKRILKPKKRYTLCFHNKEFKIWTGILDIFKKNDFCLETVEIFDLRGSSYNKNWATFSPKSDLYLTFISSPFSYKYNRPFHLEDVVKKSVKAASSKNPPEIYDLLVKSLIFELYFNKFQLDLSRVTIKSIDNLIETT